MQAQQSNEELPVIELFHKVKLRVGQNDLIGFVEGVRADRPANFGEIDVHLRVVPSEQAAIEKCGIRTPLSVKELVSECEQLRTENAAMRKAVTDAVAFLDDYSESGKYPQTCTAIGEICYIIRQFAAPSPESPSAVTREWVAEYVKVRDRNIAMLAAIRDACRLCTKWRLDYPVERRDLMGPSLESIGELLRPFLAEHEETKAG